MSISAATATQPWSWPNGADPSGAATTAQAGTSAFQAALMQWQNSIANGTQASTTPSPDTQPGQASADGIQHHHHHHYEADGSQQTSNSPTGSSIQSTLSSLVGDIVSALQSNRSGTGAAGSTSTNAGVAGGTSTNAAPAGTTTPLQSAANTSVADIAQATRANGATAGSSAAGSAATNASTASIQAAENTLAADIHQALQAYGASQATGANSLASL